MKLLHPGAAVGCPRCDARGYTLEADGERAIAVRCACTQTCPVCGGSGWTPARAEDRRGPMVRCSCQEVERRMRLFKDAQIPARHKDSTLKSFDARDVRTAPALGQVFRWLAEGGSGLPGRGLVLHGDVGRGKTHLLCALLRELALEHGHSVRFVEFSHLVADLKSSFDRGSGAADLLAPLTRVEVLGIDELGKGRNTEFEGTVVDEVVSRRYNARTVILATTNYAPGPSSGLLVPNNARPDQQPRLVDRLGDRVYSRIEEMCDFVPVHGDDWRQRSRPWARSAR
jgi:DNA replication protein DnaC